jgi:hypothetical protein
MPSRSWAHMLPSSRVTGRVSAPALATLLVLVLAVPVGAQGQSTTHREAKRVLDRAEALAEGRGVRTGRELSVALAELAARRPALSRTDREQADQLLARPTDAGESGQPGGPYSAAARVLKSCALHFCIHWVDSSADAPPAENADACPDTPDYVEIMRRSFEQSYATENVQLGWRAPVSDGDLGGDAKTDVYVKDIGAQGIYGYAATDPGQSGRSRHAFQVMDNDYSPAEFEYDDPLVPLQVTAAHEYNHILQYAYDTLQDIWMFESTATWAEDKVFDDANDWHFYMPSWRDQPGQPLTDAGDNEPPASDDLKMYSTAIWNHWLERRYGADVVRRAWEVSIAGGGFAPGAYDTAIREQAPAGVGFAEVFAEFAAATAEWRAPDSGIHEGAEFTQPLAVKDVPRAGDLVLGAATTSLTLDHTAYALYRVPLPTQPGETAIRLSGSLKQAGASPPGAVGSIALVGRTAGGEVTKVLDEFDAAGAATVTLPAAADYARVTAVVVNADTSRNGTDPFDEVAGDWNWTRDGQQATLTAIGATGPAVGRVVDGAGAPTPTGAAPVADCSVTTVEREPVVESTPTHIPTSTPTPTPVATATPTATPTPPPTATAASVRLTRAATRLRTIARRGLLPLFADVSKPGRLTATATVDAATAKRLKLGRRATRIATGRRTATGAARVMVALRLTRKARAALKRQTRTVRVKVRTTFVPADGVPAVTRAITLPLRR